VSFAAITLCVASQRVFIFIVVYFVIDSVLKFFGYTLIHFNIILPSILTYFKSILRTRVLN